MEYSSPSPLLLLPPSDDVPNTIFDSTLLRYQPSIPSQFIWPSSERPTAKDEHLQAPIIDLHGFLNGDEAATRAAAALVRTACLSHGFFQVTNHGVERGLVADALGRMEEFFGLSVEAKLRARRRKGSMWGYAGGHVDRFAEKLPWKETLSFGFRNDRHNAMVADYFTSNLGQQFEEMG